MSFHFFHQSLDEIERLAKDREPGYLEAIEKIIYERADAFRHDMSDERQAFLKLRESAVGYVRDIKRALDELEKAKSNREFYDVAVDTKLVMQLLDHAEQAAQDAITYAKRVEELTKKEELDVQ